ncbi:helix-turn-helix domain-containing protein [Ekhidna sp.]
MDVEKAISVLGIVQGLFILTLIAPSIKTSKSAFYGFMLILVFIVDLSTFFLIRNGLIAKFWFFAGFGETTLFLYGPVLYLYVESILDVSSTGFKERVLHFIPALVIFILLSPFFMAEITYSALIAWQNSFQMTVGDYRLSSLVLNNIWYSHAILYLSLCFRLLRDFKKKHIGNTSVSNLEARRTQIKWIKYLIMGYSAFPAFGLSMILFNLFFDTAANSFSLLNGFLVFHIFGISYIGFTNQKLLINPSGMLKYRKSTLNNETVDNCVDKLEQYFENKSPYLNESLTQRMVADELDMNLHHISQAINDRFGYGFNDFVNNYRIELAKKFIVSPEKSIYTIEAIANEVGFKSKPTFYTAFKKKEGITPSEFKKKKHYINDFT